MAARLSGHCMMPTYILMEQEEVNNDPHLADLEHISLLPQISVDDPAILSLRVDLEMDADEMDGRVVKFLRRSLRAGIAPFFRVVVKSSIGKSQPPITSKGVEGGIWSMDYRLPEVVVE